MSRFLRRALPSGALALALLFVSGCDRPETSAPPDAAAAQHPSALVPEEVIYEVFVRAFSDEGTFRGAVPRLDSLRALGVTTVWLMPPYAVGEARRKGTLGSPYAVRDYKGLNPSLGTGDDFRAFVDAAHARGLKVMLDWVANHTAWDHAWIEAHPEFYTKDSTGVITHPPGTDWTDVADLDYSQTAMRDSMRAALRYWVEAYDIDGYRCDVADEVPADFWRDAIADLRAIKPVLMLAEGTEPVLHEVGFDVSYGWNTYHALKEVWSGDEPAAYLYGMLEDEAERFPEGARRLRFTTNHDESAWDDTPLGLFGGTEGAQAAAVVAFTLPGVPLLYNGQEVGDPQQIPLFEEAAIDWDADPAMARFYDRLLALRAEHAALRAGTLTSVDAPDGVLAYRRTDGAETFLVVANARDAAQSVPLPEGGWTDALSGEAVAGTLDLGPYGWRILRP